MEREKLIALVSAAQKGDETAMSELFNAFYNDVYYFALKTVKDEDIACDITQETFIEIINTLGALQEPAAFVKWMKQITYHQCTRHFKKKTDVLVEEDEEGNTVFDTLQEERTEFIPDEALDQEDLKQTILSMLDELSEEQRSAVMLFYYDELSVKEIAQMQGVSENTIKSRLNYARKGIQKSVEDYEKKSGIKLHCAGVLPLLLWLLKDYFAKPAPAAKAVATRVAAATGVALTASTSATVAATTVVAAGISAKLIAGIMAAVLTVGGITAAVVLNKGDDTAKDTEEETKAVIASQATPAPTEAASAPSETETATATTPTSAPTSLPTASTAPVYTQVNPWASKPVTTPTTAPTVASTVVPSTAPTTAPIQYYDTARLTSSSKTIGQIVNRLTLRAESSASFSSMFSVMDIFGYNLTTYELGELGWCHGNYNVEDTILKSAFFNLRLPIKTRDELISLIQRDYEVFKEFLAGKGYPYRINCDGVRYNDFDQLPMESFAGVADSNCYINATTTTPYSAGNRMVQLTLRQEVILQDGIYIYHPAFMISFVD